MLRATLASVGRALSFFVTRVALIGASYALLGALLGTPAPAADDTTTISCKLPLTSAVSASLHSLTVSYDVSRDGKIANLTVVHPSGNAAADDTALACIRAWQYPGPAPKSRVESTIDLSFLLKGRAPANRTAALPPVAQPPKPPILSAPTPVPSPLHGPSADAGTGDAGKSPLPKTNEGGGSTKPSQQPYQLPTTLPPPAKQRPQATAPLGREICQAPPTAFRVALGFLLFASTVLSIWIAYSQKAFLRDVRKDLDEFQTEEIKKRGRPFKDPQDLLDRINKIVEAFLASSRDKLLRHGLWLFVTGFLVPSVVFAVYLYNYACLFGTSQPFVDNALKPIAHPSILQLATLIVEQLALGVQGFSDTIALFGRDISHYLEGASLSEPIKFNDVEFGARSSELAYRYFVGGFVLVLLDYVASYVRTRFFYVTAQQEKLKQAINEAASTSQP